MCRIFCKTAAKLQFLLYFRRLVRAGTGVTSPGILVSLEKFEDEFEEKLEVKMPLGWGRQGEDSAFRKFIMGRCTVPLR